MATGGATRCRLSTAAVCSSPWAVGTVGNRLKVGISGGEGGKESP